MNWKRLFQPLCVLASVAGGSMSVYAAPAPVDYFTAPVKMERLLGWGERPDWSPDGTKIVFTDAQNDGQLAYAFEMDLKTRKVRCLTCHLGPDAGKVVRIYYLPDGNFLVTRGQDPQSSSPLNAGIYWLSAAADTQPVYLKAGAMGDIAIARRAKAGGGVSIAWGSRREDGSWDLTTGTLTGEGSAPTLGERRTVYHYDPSKPGKISFAEAYDFVDEDRSVAFFTIERPKPNGEMYKIDLTTGAMTNLSQSPQHNEAHAFPDDRFVLEESNRASDPDGPMRGISGFPPQITPWLLDAAGIALPPGAIDTKAPPRYFDLHVVAYDGTGRVRRLTHVSDKGGDAHQSAPSPDGKQIIFCLEEHESAALKGQRGLYLMTFQ